MTLEELQALAAEKREELEQARARAAAALRELERAASAHAQVLERLAVLERLERARAVR